jgi:FlaA1/EpsC-like NDP-sugar epimerase
MHGIAGWERRRRVSSEAGEPGNRPGRFKMILVTGATGTHGSEIVKRMAA